MRRKMGTMVAATAAGPIEYTDTGSGPVVLLLHGACSTGRERVVHPPLARAGFRLVIPSRPGHGRTPLMVDATPARAADAMAALLAAIGIERAMVVAVSTGAPTGANLAARHPGLVSGLVLESALIAPPSGEILPCHGLRGKLLRLAATIAPRLAAARLLAATTTRPGSSGLLRRADLEAVRRFCSDRDPQAGSLADRSHTIEDAVLASIRAPTLLVHGRGDRAAPFSGAERAHALIPRSRLFAAEAAGHLLWLGPAAEQTTQRVIAFLKEHAPRD